jgi:hypothetical protein
MTMLVCIVWLHFIGRFWVDARIWLWTPDLGFSAVDHHSPCAM